MDPVAVLHEHPGLLDFMHNLCLLHLFKHIKCYWCNYIYHTIKLTIYLPVLMYNRAVSVVYYFKSFIIIDIINAHPFFLIIYYSTIGFLNQKHDFDSSSSYNIMMDSYLCSNLNRFLFYSNSLSTRTCITDTPHDILLKMNAFLKPYCCLAREKHLIVDKFSAYIRKDLPTFKRKSKKVLLKGQ